MKTANHAARRRFLTLSADRVQSALDALLLFKRRQAGQDLPKGSVCRGRWEPAKSERCSCCRDSNRPRSSHGMSLRHHCLSLAHCEAVHHVRHADVEAVQEALNQMNLKPSNPGVLKALLAHHNQVQFEKGVRSIRQKIDRLDVTARMSGTMRQIQRDFSHARNLFNVRRDGTVEVNRAVLHESEGYRQQLDALKCLSRLMASQEWNG